VSSSVGGVVQHVRVVEFGPKPASQRQHGEDEMNGDGLTGSE